MNLWYIDRVPSSLRAEFSNKLIQIANALGVEPNWLMMIFMLESGVSPSIQNSIGATGLIQFMPSTATGLGTSTAHLRAMNHVQQLDWVYKYYQPYVGKIKDGADLYLATFYPLALRKPDDYIIGSEQGGNYLKKLKEQNKVFFKYHNTETITKRQWKEALYHIISDKLNDINKINFFFQNKLTIKKTMNKTDTYLIILAMLILIYVGGKLSINLINK